MRKKKKNQHWLLLYHQTTCSRSITTNSFVYCRLPAARRKKKTHGVIAVALHCFQRSNSGINFYGRPHICLCCGFLAGETWCRPIATTRTNRLSPAQLTRLNLLHMYVRTTVQHECMGDLIWNPHYGGLSFWTFLFMRWENRNDAAAVEWCPSLSALRHEWRNIHK